MNLWSDDDGSLTEAFIFSSAMEGFPWTPSSSSQSAVTSSDPPRTLAPPAVAAAPAYYNQGTLQQRLESLLEGARKSWTHAIFWQSSDPTRTLPPPAPAYFNQEMVHQRLQILLEGARESWTYAIFWRSSVDAASGAPLLRWGNGYYKGCEEDKASAADQENRKRVIRELSLLIAAADGSSPGEPMEDEIPDAEWFFLLSMTELFVNGAGLPGQALYSDSPSWIASTDRLVIAPCDRAQQAQEFGIRTMVCVPVLGSGVLEIGSTDLIFHSNEIMREFTASLNFNSLEIGSGSWLPPHTNLSRL